MIAIGLLLPDVEDDVSSDGSKVTSSLSGVDNDDNWHYGSRMDEMTGNEYRLASVESDNEIDFDFPYSSSTGQLILRTYEGDLDIILKMGSGQIMPSIGGTEYAEFKFDDGSVKKITFNSAETTIDPIIFFNKEQSILRDLQKSKKLMLRVPFFESGRQTLYFNVEGLKID